MRENALSAVQISSSNYTQTLGVEPGGEADARQPDRYSFILKLFMISVFLPEGLSLFVGSFRLPFYRILILGLFGFAVQNALTKSSRSAAVRVPSDAFALAAGAWIITAGLVNDGMDVGLKASGADALEFTGSYYLFRHLLGPTDSSVMIMRFACLTMIPVIILALLDPLTGHLFTHDLITNLTGYFKPYDFNGELYIRNGLFRAMGPFEHSILFAAACSWFAILALSMFRLGPWGVSIQTISLVGIWFSQARGPLAAYVIGLGLTVYYAKTKRFAARWRVVGTTVAAWVAFVFLFSRSPVSTLLSFGGVDPSAGWYREAIWATAGPMVLNSPIFGIGSLAGVGWWENNPVLMGPTMDSLWLVCAFQYGIPGSVLVLLTLIGSVWLGPVDNAMSLSEGERSLSVALGIVMTLVGFLAFIVHMWGPCWVLLGVFPGIRANLAEVAIVRARVSHPNTSMLGVNQNTEDADVI